MTYHVILFTHTNRELLKKSGKITKKGRRASPCQNRNWYFLTVCLCENEKRTLLLLHVAPRTVPLPALLLHVGSTSAPCQQGGAKFFTVTSRIFVGGTRGNCFLLSAPTATSRTNEGSRLGGSICASMVRPSEPRMPSKPVAVSFVVPSPANTRPRSRRRHRRSSLRDTSCRREAWDPSRH